MIKGLNTIRPGSLLFVAQTTSWISWLITIVIKFNYSHVAYYLGCGKILEANWSGVEITDLSKYIGRDDVIGEVLASPLEDAQIEVMSQEMLKYLEARYDYTLLFGSALTKIILRCNKTPLLRLFDNASHWMCSELVAHGLKHAGMKLPKKVEAMTPRDVYNFVRKELEHVR